MNVKNFLNTYFKEWAITQIGTSPDVGYIILRHGETKIKIKMRMNGAKHWTSNEVSIIDIVGVDE